MSVLEVARLYIQPETQLAFETAIQEGYQYLSATEGYQHHQLRRCIEDPTEYLLTIAWDSVDAHMVNFRQSANFERWRELISPYLVRAPDVFHYELVHA